MSQQISLSHGNNEKPIGAYLVKLFWKLQAISIWQQVLDFSLNWKALQIAITQHIFVKEYFFTINEWSCYHLYCSMFSNNFLQSLHNQLQTVSLNEHEETGYEVDEHLLVIHLNMKISVSLLYSIFNPWTYCNLIQPKWCPNLKELHYSP